MCYLDRRNHEKNLDTHCFGKIGSWKLLGLKIGVVFKIVRNTAPASTANASDQVIVEKVNHLLSS